MRAASPEGRRRSATWTASAMLKEEFNSDKAYNAENRAELAETAGAVLDAEVRATRMA